MLVRMVEGLKANSKETSNNLSAFKSLAQQLEAKINHHRPPIFD